MSKPRYAITVPPGRYVLGDPCYSISESDWMPWLEAGGLDLVNGDRYHIMAAPTPWGMAFGIGTEYGDGSYNDQMGNSFPVDAGMIGLVPVSPGMYSALGDDRVVILLTEPTLVEQRHDNGDIVIGPHIIQTGDEWTCEDCGIELEKGSYVCGDCEWERERREASCPVCAEYSDNPGEVCNDCAKNEA